ncbi:flavin reductase family protein [Paraburkholderia acidisoli]|uniref:Flavin reductase n=1 Tax=Paraburkholderia acidisoli TaxID=2571748 RepID=A0A7Z2GRK1_9BURK|nr:flavin reductase family protein [Paraburkholderia acidisoli]QGZ66662.1 flavin reductase [Paraburkholderia acidisoli]
MNAPEAIAAPGLAAAEFKRGMRQLAASVSIITAHHAGQRAGLTATAVTSVCADPPTLLVCVNRSSQTFPLMRAAGRFSVNLLAAEHSDVAARFADAALHGEAKFAHGVWHAGDNGAPRLHAATATFECETRSLSEVGTHGIFVAAVTRIHVDTGRAPLLHFDGALVTLPPAASASARG